jgi:hypothetical protein
MAAVDLLFNHGPRSRDILMSGNISRAEMQANEPIQQRQQVSAR